MPPNPSRVSGVDLVAQGLVGVEPLGQPPAQLGTVLDRRVRDQPAEAVDRRVLLGSLAGRVVHRPSLGIDALAPFGRGCSDTRPEPFDGQEMILPPCYG